MYFTPTKLKKRSTTEAFSTTGTQLSGRMMTESDMNRYSVYGSGSNKSLERPIPITKLTICITKKKISLSKDSWSKEKSTSREPKASPVKFRASII